MFSKAKKKQADTERKPVPAANAELQKTQAQTPASAKQNTATKSSSKRSSNMKSPGVPSLISTDVTLDGNLISSGEVQFDGNISGNIRAASLIIGEKASVKGEVACEAVTVRGRVEGMVRARNVALASTAHIEGDIMHSSLSVEPGAHFDGNCRHSDDPLADDASKAFDRPVSGGPNKSAPRPVPSSSLEENNSHSAAQDASSFRSTGNDDLNGAADAHSINAIGSNGKNQNGASSFLAKNRSPLR